MSRLAIVVGVIFLFSGCSEGILWKTGHYSPWAKEKWHAEDKLAETLFAKKRQLREMVTRAKNGSDAEKQQAALALKEIVHRDPILLRKLHAISLLPEIPATESMDALRLASQDPNSQVRKAAIASLQKIGTSSAAAQLQELIGSDTDVDVRLQATRALGSFSDPGALSALRLALSDSDPAIQLRATESLGKITGENIGANVAKWQNYLGGDSHQATASAADSLIR